jgi:hypothetical protein
MILLHKYGKVCHLMIAAIMGAIYAFCFSLLIVIGFAGAVESPDASAFIIPLLGCGFLEILLLLMAKKLARNGMLIVSDAWFVMLTAVLFVAGFFGYVLIDDELFLREFVVLLIGIVIFSFPVYYPLKKEHCHIQGKGSDSH